MKYSVAVGLAAVALLAGACSGDEPAAAKEPDRDGAFAYAKCMRENGVPKFPDPDGSGGLAVDGDVVGMDTPQYRAADEKCKRLMPPRQPEKVSAAERAEMLKYSRCMRENGVSGFPDPNPGGGLGVDAGKIGMDPQSPVYQAAEKTCAKYFRPGKGGNSKEHRAVP